MSEQQKTQGTLLGEYMDAKGISPEALAEKLQDAAKEVLETVDKKRVNRWLMDKEAIPVTLVPAITAILERSDTDRAFLKQAARDLKSGLDAKAQQTAAATAAAPAAEPAAPETERDISPLVAASKAISKVGVDAAFDHRDPAGEQERDVARLSDEEVMARRKAAGVALRALMAATPKSEAEIKKRARISDSGNARQVDPIGVIPVELADRKDMKLKRSDISQRLPHNDHAPSARITPAEMEMIVSVLEQSVDGRNVEFNKAVNAFSKAVAESQSAWDQHEAQETARHAKAEADRAARVAARKNGR